MPLSVAEKLAGREFRNSCQAQLDAIPFDARCSPFSVWFRHDCQGESWAMHLKQHYWTSPGSLCVPDGKFAFTFRMGTCPRCGLVVRSGSWRFVIAEENPPEKGAVIGRPGHENRVVPPGEAGAAHSPGLDG